MLDYLYGKVVAIQKESVVVDVQGIGFRVQLPSSLPSKLSLGTMQKLFISMLFKNEEFKLYGFSTHEERRLFEKLQSVSGIGPALAMNIVSAISPSALYHAIFREDISIFKKIKGVGTKTAKRLILELKGSLKKEEFVEEDGLSSSSIPSDTVLALISLGYSQEEAWNAVENSVHKVSQTLSPEELLRIALQYLQNKEKF